LPEEWKDCLRRSSSSVDGPQVTRLRSRREGKYSSIPVKPLRSIFYVALLLCAVAQAEVTIGEVGLSGYISRGPNRVTVEISNPSSSPQEFTLRLSMRTSGPDEGAYTDRRLRLEGGESRKVDLPFYFVQGTKLVVLEIGPDGQVVASAEKQVTSPEGRVVAVVCSSTPTCTATAQAIRAGNSIEERNAREQKLKLILLEQPPESWVAYNPASSVVVAGQISSPASRAAIVDYARLGGNVIIATDLAPRDFLAEYRVPGRREVAVGHGLVTFLASATGTEMEDAFHDETPQGGEPVISLAFGLTPNWLLSRVGTRFEFPRLWWLIGWMATYTVLIGLVNFLVLRRIGKIELAWITVPALALIFGVVFYAFSMHGKMRNFALDEVSVCWMDDKSARGALSQNVRVSSPRLRDVTLRIPASSIMHSVDSDPLFRVSEVADIWSEHRVSRSENVPDVMIDSAQHVQLEMLRFSFRDLSFESFENFPGTVRLYDGHLKNSTGQTFREAALVDFEKREFYDLGNIGDGAEVEAFAKGPQKMLGTNVPFSPLPPGPFHLPEAMRLWNFQTDSPGQYLVFFGLTDQPLLGPQLEGIASEHKTHTLFMVKVGRPQ